LSISVAVSSSISWASALYPLPISPAFQFASSSTFQLAALFLAIVMYSAIGSFV